MSKINYHVKIKHNIFKTVLDQILGDMKVDFLKAIAMVNKMIGIFLDEENLVLAKDAEWQRSILVGIKLELEDQVIEMVALIDKAVEEAQLSLECVGLIVKEIISDTERIKVEVFAEREHVLVLILEFERLFLISCKLADEARPKKEPIPSYWFEMLAAETMIQENEVLRKQYEENRALGKKILEDKMREKKLKADQASAAADPKVPLRAVEETERKADSLGKLYKDMVCQSGQVSKIQAKFDDKMLLASKSEEKIILMFARFKKQISIINSLVESRLGGVL